MSAETLRLPSGRIARVGERVFDGPDFYAVLVDADEEFIIVRDDLVLEGEASDFILFRWETDRPRRDHDSGRIVGRGAYVLVASDSDSKWGIDR